MNNFIKNKSINKVNNATSFFTNNTSSKTSSTITVTSSPTIPINSRYNNYIPPAGSIILYKDTSPFLSAPVSKGDKVVQGTTSVGYILVALPQNSKYIIIGKNPSAVTSSLFNSQLFNTNSSLIINQGI